MAGNPWKKYNASPWVLMIGSGSIGDFNEEYEGFGTKSGRSVTTQLRPWAVSYLKLTLDHLIKARPRLIRDPSTVRDKYDFYFDSSTANRVKIFQGKHGLTSDGIVGRMTMSVFWELGRGDSLVRKNEHNIRTLMLEFIRMNLSSYKRVG